MIKQLLNNEELIGRTIGQLAHVGIHLCVRFTDDSFARIHLDCVDDYKTRPTDKVYLALGYHTKEEHQKLVKAEHEERQARLKEAAERIAKEEESREKQLLLTLKQKYDTDERVKDTDRGTWIREKYIRPATTKARKELRKNITGRFPLYVKRRMVSR